MASAGRLVSPPALIGSLFGKRTRKPNSVLCGHSSRRSVTARAHQRPTRRFRHIPEPPCRIGPMRSRRMAPGPGFPPYLVLLRVGFTLPQPLLAARCALTAPFHPYSESPRGGMFSVALAVHGHRRGDPASRTLSGTLPCGVRTFLPRKPRLHAAPAATARSSCQRLL
jgi:hypothetical protein